MKFSKVEKNLYRCEIAAEPGAKPSVRYYARFVDHAGVRRSFPLGPGLSKARDLLGELRRKNDKEFDFDAEKRKAEEHIGPADGRTRPYTFSEWAQKYTAYDDVRRKRSLQTDMLLIRLHLNRFFGSTSLADFDRESLSRYVEARMGEKLIRGGHRRMTAADGTVSTDNPKLSSKPVKRGTVSNELACLRRMLRVAAREGFKVAVPSFEGLIIRRECSGRALSVEEQAKVNAVYPQWMRRLAEFATETCLSLGDLLRLTEDMIDRRTGVVIPEGGRKKSETKQISPLTPRALAILNEIRAEKRAGGIVQNINALICTREDGRAVTKGMVDFQVEQAVKASGVKKFVFHNYRNTALTEWARQGINVDLAMLAAGHSPVQMHKRYLQLGGEDIAKAFGTGEKNGKMK